MRLLFAFTAVLAAQTTTEKGNLNIFSAPARKQIELLYSEDAGDRANGAHRLGNMGVAAAVPYLAGLLDDGAMVQEKYISGFLAGIPGRSFTVGEVAGRAMGKLGAVKDLLRVFRDEEQDETAVDSAGAGLLHPDTPARMQLANGLAKDKADYIRERTVCLLKQHAENGNSMQLAVPVLISALQEENRTTLLCAIEALGGAKDARASAPLRSLLAGKDDEIAQAALGALATMPGPEAFQTLLSALEGSDSDLRGMAAEALGERKDRRAIPALLAALAGPDKSVHANALRALIAMPDPRSFAPALALLNDAASDLRQDAAELLGELKDLRAVPPLAALMGEKESLSGAAASALARLGKPGADALFAAVKSEDANQRVAAARALAESTDPRAIPTLFTLLRDDAETAASAARDALAAMDKRPLAAAIAALASKEAILRSEAASLLGSIKDRSAIGPLIGALDDAVQDVRAKAADALSEITGQEFDDPAEWKRWWRATRPPPRKTGPVKK